MKEEELKELLEKYYDGSSSPDEEELIRSFFAENSPKGFEAEKEIFSFFNTKKPIPDPSIDFELRIIEGIGSSEAERSVLRGLFIKVAGVAASLIILAGSYLILSQRSRSVDTFTDPSLAYAETMKILYAVSVKMNKGTTGLEPVARLSDITEKSIGEIINTSAKMEKNLSIFSKEIQKADTSIMKAKN